MSRPAAARGSALALIAVCAGATVAGAAAPVRPPATERVVIGRSAEGRAIVAVRIGPADRARRVLVVGCIHGDERAGLAVTRRLLAGAGRAGAALWVVPSLNPDGEARRTRQNARGVDLNRNFPSEWRPIGRLGDPEHSGPRALSEPETRAAVALIARLRPAVTIWFHQPQALVRAWGPSVSAARRYAQLAGVPFGRLRWPPGTAANWQNHRFPASAAFVVELPAGPLPERAARAHAQAVIAIARAGP